MKYTIIEKRDGKKYPYFDPFTNQIYQSDKSTAQKVAFMLGFQHNGIFEVEPIK